MTTEEMKFALLRHFRYLGYRFVATECTMTTPEGWHFSSFVADILAIGKEVIIEIEIKQHPWEIKKDLETKAKKHNCYLQTNELWRIQYKEMEKETIRPHKFYFACPIAPTTLDIDEKNYIASCLSNMPSLYGLILIYSMYDCRVNKRAKWLHRDLTHMRTAKERMCLRLVGENIFLRGERLENGDA